jgi:hypothetical protein
MGGRLGGIVLLEVYDGRLMVKGYITDAHYQNAEGLEDFVISTAAVDLTGNEDVDANELLAYVHQEITWRKDPEAPE